jgi:hypothetical protein
LKRTYRILMQNFYWNADQIAAFYVRSDLPNSNPDLPPETVLTCHLRQSVDLPNSKLSVK